MKKTLLALALLGASSTAMADSWIYGGASVGQSDYEGKHGTAYSVHAGTGILPFIGLEAGYVNHGDFEINATQELSASSLYFAVKPSMDFGLCTFTPKAVCTHGIKTSTVAKSMMVST